LLHGSWEKIRNRPSPEQFYQEQGYYKGPYGKDKNAWSNGNPLGFSDWPCPPFIAIWRIADGRSTVKLRLVKFRRGDREIAIFYFVIISTFVAAVYVFL